MQSESQLSHGATRKQIQVSACSGVCQGALHTWRETTQAVCHLAYLLHSGAHARVRALVITNKDGGTPLH